MGHSISQIDGTVQTISIGEEVFVFDETPVANRRFIWTSELYENIDLSTLPSCAIYSIFTEYNALQIQIIESHFAGNMHDKFCGLQYRLLKAQEPRLPELVKLRKTCAKLKPKPKRTRKLCRLLGALAESAEIEDPIVKDGFSYLQAVCLGWLAFSNHPNSLKSVMAEIKAMSSGMDPVKYYEGLVEASERYLQTAPILNDVNEAASTFPFPPRDPQP